MTHVLTFDPSGTGRCLYTEILDLNSIGALEVKRASHIEFDNESQKWEVRNQIGMVLYSHPSREICLQWEHQYFNR
ncbi:MAG: hypothetical protein ACK4UN_20565 [Limisphaerales bacterium]